MNDRSHKLLKNMLELSREKVDHLEFIGSVHQLFCEELNLPESAFILSFDNYFLKSYHNSKLSDYWDIRTNELTAERRFVRLTDIARKELDFSDETSFCLEISEMTAPVGYILGKNSSSMKTVKILEETKDFFYLICKSLFRQFQLNERVKELSCLHNISKMAEKREMSIQDFLTRIVNLLPPAWQFPHQARARIVYRDNVFQTPGFAESEFSLKAPILLDQQSAGFVEVNYPQEFILSESFPFQKEEEGLLITIAQELSLILEKKKAEEESRHLEKQLRHADRLATLGQLSAGIAHEINEPLAGILGLAQLLEKNDSLDKQALTDLENIVSASLHAREVVKKLMLFARQMPSVQTYLNLNEAVNNAIFFLESRCRKNMVRLHLDLKEGLPLIQADSSQIHQVLINLIVNAMQAMPDGGIITLKTSFDAESVFLECSDTGIGMSKSVLNQIFNPFFTTKKVNEGTGLGLSVVHGIIYSHGGEISVSSQPGKGAKFIISFPQLNKAVQNAE